VTVFYSVVTFIVSYKCERHLTAKHPCQTAKFQDNSVTFPDFPESGKLATVLADNILEA